jgi:hypothetical protein
MRKPSYATSRPKRSKAFALPSSPTIFRRRSTPEAFARDEMCLLFKRPPSNSKGDHL